MPSFWIGVWAQPVESFAKWKQEGVNIVVKPDPSNNNTAEQRRAACAAASLYYIDQPTDAADCAALVADPWCYGVMYPDEASQDIVYPASAAPKTGKIWYSADPAAWSTAVALFNSTWNAILAPAKGVKAIFSNFPGGDVWGARPWNNGGECVPIAPLATVVCQDTYPINTNFAVDWTQWNAGQGLPVSLTPNANPNVDPLAVGTTQSQYGVRCLKSYFPGLPVWSYVETCLFQTNPLGQQMTASLFNQETASLLKEGLSGLLYFTHNFNGPGWNPGAPAGQSNWDGRPADVVAACIALNAQLAGPVTPPPPTTPTLDQRVSAIEQKLAAIKALL